MTIDLLDLRCTCGHQARVHREYITESGSGCAHWLCPGCPAYDEMEGQQMSTELPRPIGPGDIRAFDPAALWPRGSGRWCAAWDSYWRCCRDVGHDGLHAAYTSVDAEGIQPAYVWGRP